MSKKSLVLKKDPQTGLKNLYVHTEPETGESATEDLKLGLILEPLSAEDVVGIINDVWSIMQEDE